MREEVLLEARGISKAFPGVQALDQVGLRVRHGRLTALVGENGAGKSTLMNILAGVLQPDTGEIRLAGRPVTFPNPRAAQEAGISIIFQELNLAPSLTVAENIFLGREPLNRLGLIDYARLHRETRALLDSIELPLDPDALVSRLKVGQQQGIEIAKALSFRARIVIMDEPTSALSDTEVTVLFRLIQQLKAGGAGLVYITHKLDELAGIADDLTVFRDGRHMASRPFHEVNRNDIVRLMVGRELAHTAPRPAHEPGAEVLRVHNLSLRHPDRPEDRALRQVSFSLRRGEVLGVFGLLGAGRTSLLHTLFGLHPRTSTGTVEVDGRPVRLRSPEEAIAAGLALAPEDRQAEGLILLLGVAANISLPCLPRLERFGLIHAARERALATRFVNRLGIKTPSLNQVVRHLSGGNQQKVVLARGLATEPRVLLLDEPTRGIDVGAKKEIYALIEELARGGLGVLLVSSELPEILAVADRILVLAEGRVTLTVDRAEATEELLLQAALPNGRRQPGPDEPPPATGLQICRDAPHPTPPSAPIHPDALDRC